MGDEICDACKWPINDGEGPGYVKRHNNTEEHVEAIKRNQKKAADLLKQRDAHGYVPWSAIEVDEEDEERIELRRALERAQREEVE